MERKDTTYLGGDYVMVPPRQVASSVSVPPSSTTTTLTSSSSPSQKTPIQVFILLGQSNMLGMGKVQGTQVGSLEQAVREQHLYPYLANVEDATAAAAAENDDDDDNEAFQWTTSQHVRNVRVMSSGMGPMKVYTNEFMSAARLKTIGPELGIGHMLEQQHQQFARATSADHTDKNDSDHCPAAIGINGSDSHNSNDNSRILLLKSCIGNRSLGWDLLPPGSKSFEYTDPRTGVTWVYPGYRDSPSRWKKGEAKPAPTSWYAGMQYDGDVRNIHDCLSEIHKYYPKNEKEEKGEGGTTPNAAKEEDYTIAGFFWWQGDKDSRDAALAGQYEENLVRLIRQLRYEFNAPRAKFVCATLGQTVEGGGGNDGKLLDAMFAVDGNRSDKYPEFKGNVATVYTHPLSKGGSSGGHYNKNAMTYMNVGESMGKAMVDLLKGGGDMQNQ